MNKLFPNDHITKARRLAPTRKVWDFSKNDTGLAMGALFLIIVGFAGLAAI